VISVARRKNVRKSIIRKSVATRRNAAVRANIAINTALRVAIST